MPITHYVRDAQSGEVLHECESVAEVDAWYATAYHHRLVMNSWDVASEFRAQYLSRHKRHETWVVMWL